MKAASAVGRTARAVIRNVQARLSGAISNAQGAATSELLWTEIARQQETQKLARAEKAARLKLARRRKAAGRAGD